MPKEPTHVRDENVIRDLIAGGSHSYKSINEAKRASRMMQKMQGAIVSAAKQDTPEWKGCKIPQRSRYAPPVVHSASFKPKMSRVDALVESRRFAPAND